MTSARVNAFSQRHSSGDRNERDQRQARDRVVHQRLMRAARSLVLQWRREAGGAYRFPAGAALALCEAVDESVAFFKGVEQ